MMSSERSFRITDGKRCEAKNEIEMRFRRRHTRWSVSNYSLFLLALLALSYFPDALIPVLVGAADDDYYNDGSSNNNDASSYNTTNDDAVDSNGNDAAAQDSSEQTDDNVATTNDDLFHFRRNGFGAVSLMPTSCIHYNNGHMIKFDFFENNGNSKQCRFNHIGSFVVSIAHYMRAYFNDQALLLGEEFVLPGDAGYLNCVLLQETANSQTKLYAKIGCMDRETFTSTKLQLHVYTDAQCSVKFDDGESSKKHSSRGYEINGYYLSTRVSFRPPFYNCQACIPNQISETFNKKNGNWYDDDYISEHGKKDASYYNKNTEDEKEQDDFYGDDYFSDDTYMYANDDVLNGDGNRQLKKLTAVPDQLEEFGIEFWKSMDQYRRSLYDNYYDVGDWNICQRIFKYGVWCDEECQSLDSFRVDEWSKADIFLLVTMCAFMAAMMLLVVAKRVKASQKARNYGDESYKPGLPPLAMALIFLVIIAIIIVLAKLKFINETLVFAVVTCILLFIYMLKLTLFESRRPVLLAAPRHDMFDNPLDDRLFN